MYQSDVTTAGDSPDARNMTQRPAAREPLEGIDTLPQI